MSRMVLYSKTTKLADEFNAKLLFVIAGQNLLVLYIFQYTTFVASFTFILMIITTALSGHVLNLLLIGFADLESCFNTTSIYGDFRKPTSKVLFTLIAQLCFSLLFWQAVRDIQGSEGYSSP